MSDHSNVTPAGYSLETALALAAVGYKLVPIPAGFKYPKGFGRWQEIATDDAAQVTTWLEHTTHGFGLAMGLQPNGKHLFAVDIDGEAGMDTLITLLKQFGGQDLFMNTANQNTGNNGAHFIFEADHEVRNSAKQFAAHIDIRGEGGQIVVGPTIHPNGNPYVWNRLLSNHPPLHAPTWVMERIAEMDRKALPVAQLDVQRETSTDSPLDWANEHMDSAALLHANGWLYSHSGGGDQFWVRPGKPVRDGHSAVLHDDGVLVVFTTEVGPEFGICKTGAGGTLVATPFDLYCIFDHGGNVSEAMRHIRFTLMPGRLSPPAQSVTGRPEDHSHPEVSLNLPDEFWEARPWLLHIRDCAYSRRVSPDALLVAVMARFACLIRPTLQIPTIIGSTATFDFISCVVAKSAGGKTIANGVAEELIRTTEPEFMLSAPIGSGEGLVQAFMGYDKDEKGKRIGDPSYKFGEIKAIHFVADEATALMEQTARKGVTIVQTLCSAWSGATLGQLNASIETRRLVPGKARRVTACLNIQTLRGHELLADSLRAVGFPQRILFAWAHSPLPSVIPDWPGPLDYKLPPQLGEITYHPEIVRQCQEAREAVMTETVVLDDLDGHQGLLKLKAAGIMALLGGSMTVTLDDWDLTELLLQTHRNVRSTLISVHAANERDGRHAAAEARGNSEYVAETARERRYVDDLAQRIVSRVQACQDPEGLPLGRTRANMTAKKSRHRWEPAVQRALESGKVVVHDNHLQKA